uniref:hypothetical protein n=1 Tax=Cupriavidus yeoncheonensis TaxID=1462994 RepID=UPI003F497F07
MATERAIKKTALNPMEESRRTSKKKSGNALRRRLQISIRQVAVASNQCSSSVRKKTRAYQGWGAGGSKPT